MMFSIYLYDSSLMSWKLLLIVSNQYCFVEIEFSVTSDHDRPCTESPFLMVISPVKTAANFYQPAIYPTCFSEYK